MFLDVCFIHDAQYKRFVLPPNRFHSSIQPAMVPHSMTFTVATQNTVAHSTHISSNIVRIIEAVSYSDHVRPTHFRMVHIVRRKTVERKKNNQTTLLFGLICSIANGFRVRLVYVFLSPLLVINIILHMLKQMLARRAHDAIAR